MCRMVGVRDTHPLASKLWLTVHELEVAGGGYDNKKRARLMFLVQMPILACAVE